MREILVYTSYIFIGTVVNQINWSLGRIVLAGTVGAVAVAIYSVSEQLNQYYISMSTTVSDVFTPRVHRMAAQGASDRDFTDLFTRIGRIQFLIMAMILMGFAVFGESFIGKWAGVEYVGTGAYLCGVLLFVANLVPGIQNVGIAIQQSKNLHRFRSLLYLTLCFVNIGVAIPLSRAFGPLGAAVAMLAVTLFGNGLVMNIYYHKKIGIDIPYFWRQIASMCRGLAAPLLYGAFVLLFIDTDSWRRMAVFGALFVAVYLVSMWFFGMNDYERGLFTRPLKKRFARPSRRNG